jgi:hypothetical protein
VVKYYEEGLSKMRPSSQEMVKSDAEHAYDNCMKYRGLLSR